MKHALNITTNYRASRRRYILHRRHGFDPFDVFICRECGMWQPRRTSVVLGA